MCINPIGYGIKLPYRSWGLYNNQPTRYRIKIIDKNKYWQYAKNDEVDKSKLVILKCGTCIDCKAQAANEWATRCVNEASMHADNCFLTLTYNEKNLPRNYRREGILIKKDLTNFKKRLRKAINCKIKTFECGEYGEKGRPHFHMLIFGWKPKDLQFLKYGKNKNPLFKSKFLANKWGKGYVTIGMISAKSAAYVARYTSKKLMPKEKQHLPKPFINMSRREGIGKRWVLKNLYKILDDKNIVVDGIAKPIPKYYKKVIWDCVTQQNELLMQTDFILNEYKKGRNAINKPYLEWKKYLELNKDFLKVSDYETKKIESKRKKELDNFKKDFYNSYGHLLARNVIEFKNTIIDYLRRNNESYLMQKIADTVRKGGEKYLQKLNSLKVDRLKKLKRGLE